MDTVGKDVFLLNTVTYADFIATQTPGIQNTISMA